MSRPVRPPRGTAAEPTSHDRLAWGDYEGRYLIGMALLLVGAALISQTTVATVGLGVLGSGMHLAGWAVQPGRPGARAAVAGPSVLLCWSTITGPKTMWLLAGVLACWLLVRRRPAATYWTLALPLGVGVLVASLYSHVADKTVAFWSVVAAVVVGAWLARELALHVRSPHTNPIADGGHGRGDTP